MRSVYTTWQGDSLRFRKFGLVFLEIRGRAQRCPGPLRARSPASLSRRYLLGVVAKCA